MRSALSLCHLPAGLRTAVVACALTLTVGAAEALAQSAAACHADTPTTPPAGTIDQANPQTSFNAANRAGAATGPGDCLGPNCSQFLLTVNNPGANDVRIRLDWQFVTNDYDLYIYDSSCNQVALSGNGTTTFEETRFSPQAGETYEVVIVHFATAPGDNIQGLAELVAPPSVTVPNRTGPDGTGIVFSPNGVIQTSAGEARTGKGTTFAPETTRDGEPSVRVDILGNMYPAGIRGVPAGVDVWRFGPQAFCPRFAYHDDAEFPAPGTDPPPDPNHPAAGYVYLGQPDGIFASEGAGSPDAGGGDIELAVGFPENPDLVTNPPILAMVSLTLANITSATSFDRGNNFTPANPVAATVPLDDRQWIEAYGENTVYLYYRTLATLTGLVLNKSIDGGETYAASTTLVNPLGFTPGYIDVDQTPNGDGSVDIYLSGTASTELVVYHCVDPTPTLPSAITCNRGVTVDNTMSHGHIFDPVVVDNAGNVYAAWSNNEDIFYAWSEDKGASWSEPIQVTAAGTGSFPAFNIFPWITAGDDGRVGIVWYGTPSADNSNDAEWKAYYAFTPNARAATPDLSWTAASDHVIHKSNVSQAGFSQDEAVNRNLIDFFQVADDPRDGAAVIAFSGDENDFDGATFFTRQIAGPGMRADVPVTTPPDGCPPLAPFRNPEVRDFVLDATTVSDTEFPRPDTDALNIDYDTVETGGETYLLADMAVTTLLVPPPQASYRMYFAVNTVRGLLDSGNEYFVEVTTENGVPEFWLGATDRTASGGTDEERLERIDADQGTTQTFGIGAPGHARARVNVERLTYEFETGDDGPAMTDPNGSPAPACGDLVIGLRGRVRVATIAVTSVVDETRGGSFIILCGPDGGSDPDPPDQDDDGDPDDDEDEPDQGDEDQDDDGEENDDDEDDDNDGENDDEDDDDDNDGEDDEEDDDDDDDGVSDNDEEGAMEDDDQDDD